MKLLLTSGGVTNPSIRAALDAMLPRPIAECSALCILTAQWGHPRCTPTTAFNFVRGSLTGLGWKQIGLLELMALPEIAPERWQAWVRDADVLLVDGGDATFLAHWLRQSGLADMLPELHDTVWVGISAGSMVLTPRIGREFVQWTGAKDDTTLGLVDFSIFPHLDHPDMSGNTMAAARDWARDLATPAYAMDDDTAIAVVDGTTRIVSEGQWEQLR